MEEISIFKSERYFKLWDFKPGHNRMLIRSLKDVNNIPSAFQNIDIVFGSVLYCSIPASGIYGLEIFDLGYQPLKSNEFKIEYAENNKKFRLKSNAGVFHIFASTCSVSYNDLDDSILMNIGERLPMQNLS